MTRAEIDALKPGDRIRLADGRVGVFRGRGDHLVTLDYEPYGRHHPLQHDITKLLDPRARKVP